MIFMDATKNKWCCPLSKVKHEKYIITQRPFTQTKISDIVYFCPCQLKKEQDKQQTTSLKNGYLVKYER